LTKLTWWSCPARSWRRRVSAAGRIIEQKGLEGASLRAIARELGCTTGVLTHHFVSKEDLLHAALAALFRPFDKRLAAANTGADRLADIRRMLLSILPISRANQAAARLWLRIVLRAVVDQSLAFDYRRRYGAIRLGFKELLDEGQKAGEFRQDFDPAVEADILLALVDGLIIHALAEPDWFPSERLVTLVDHQLERLTSPPAKARRRTQTHYN
jgi:TetR/AcrR family transcriptional regulator, transcriptional repressor of bet genes